MLYQLPFKNNLLFKQVFVVLGQEKSIFYEHHSYPPNSEVCLTHFLGIDVPLKKETLPASLDFQDSWSSGSCVARRVIVVTEGQKKWLNLFFICEPHQHFNNLFFLQSESRKCSFGSRLWGLGRCLNRLEHLLDKHAGVWVLFSAPLLSSTAGSGLHHTSMTQERKIELKSDLVEF